MRQQNLFKPGLDENEMAAARHAIQQVLPGGRRGASQGTVCEPVRSRRYGPEHDDVEARLLHQVLGAMLCAAIALLLACVGGRTRSQGVAHI